MGFIKSSLFISLDGVIEAPETWHFPYFNDQMGAVVGEHDERHRRHPASAVRPTTSSPATGRPPIPTTRSPAS